MFTCRVREARQSARAQPLETDTDAKGGVRTLTRTPGIDDSATESVSDTESRTVSWQRALVGRPETMTYPDSRTLGATFDDSSNLETLTPPSRPAHSFTYDEVDLPETFQAPGNPVESYAFNLDDQPQTLTLPSGKTVTFLDEPGTQRLEQIDTAAGACGTWSTFPAVRSPRRCTTTASGG